MRITRQTVSRLLGFYAGWPKATKPITAVTKSFGK